MWIYVVIYEDGKIECGKWQATVTAPLDTATKLDTILPEMHAGFEKFLPAVFFCYVQPPPF